MFDEYRILTVNDDVLDFKLKAKYLVVKFCGANATQRPIYRIVKQERTEQRALDYIRKKTGY